MNDTSDLNDMWEYIDEYEEKYKIRIFDSHNASNCILEKTIGRNKYQYAHSGLCEYTLAVMMLTSLKMGTNYLEDSLLAAGLKWEHHDNIYSSCI